MLGIAFEGCACRVAFHAGVAAALVEGGLPLRLASGASSGSICAVALAAGRAADMPAILAALGGPSIRAPLRRVAWNRSLFDMSHIVRSALRTHLGALDLRDRHVEAIVVATRLRDLRAVHFSSRDEPDLLDPVLGSCFIPVLYGRPVFHRGALLVDGGLTDNLPIEALAMRGADEVIAVIASPDGTALKHPGRPRWRLADPAARHATRRPLYLGSARVHVIHPARPLAIGPWDFDLDRLRRTVDEGHARGREFLGS